MPNIRIPAMKNQALIGICVLVLGLWLAWETGDKIAAGDERSLIFGASIFAGCLAVAKILHNWRTGFYLFFVWMMFEDLVRKYMGNGLALFFGKERPSGVGVFRVLRGNSTPQREHVPSSVLTVF